jgi:hypothetical protein
MDVLLLRKRILLYRDSGKAGSGTAATVIDYTQVEERAASEPPESNKEKVYSATCLQRIATLTVHALPEPRVLVSDNSRRCDDAAGAKCHGPKDTGE